MLRGMFEERLQRIIREVKERPNLILFVDEAHTMAGANSQDRSLCSICVRHPIDGIRRIFYGKARPAGLGTARPEQREGRRFPEDCLAQRPAKRVTRPAGLEPATPGLEGRCSIQLSYGRVWNESVSVASQGKQHDLYVDPGLKIARKFALAKGAHRCAVAARGFGSSGLARKGLAAFRS
jgi:hypothetical protein